LNGSDKAISAARDCFDIQRLRWIVAQRLAEFLYRRIQAVIYFFGRLTGPEFFLQFLPGDQLPRPLYKKPQDADRLGLDVEADSMLVDFAGFEIDPKWAKRTDRMGIRLEGHRRPELRPNESLNRADASTSECPRQRTFGYVALPSYDSRRNAHSLAQFGNSDINPSSDLHYFGRSDLVQNLIIGGESFFPPMPIRGQKLGGIDKRHLFLRLELYLLHFHQREKSCSTHILGYEGDRLL
jgi:hypothetical protein